MTPNLILEITRDGDRLFAQGFVQLPHNRPGDLPRPKFELFAEGEKNFFARVADHQITFETGPEGRATSLILHRAGRDMPGRPSILTRDSGWVDACARTYFEIIPIDASHVSTS